MSEAPSEKGQKRNSALREKNPAHLGQKSTWSAKLKGIVSHDFPPVFF